MKQHWDFSFSRFVRFMLLQAMLFWVGIFSKKDDD